MMAKEFDLPEPQKVLREMNPQASCRPFAAQDDSDFPVYRC